MKRAHHPSMRSNPPTQPFELIQADASGPLPPTIGGNTSFQLIIDHASQYIHLDLAKSKAAYPGKIQAFVNRVETQLQHKIKAIHTNGASEYNSAHYCKFLEDHHIKKELSAPYQPQQNSLAEHNMSTIKAMIACMLFQSGMPIGY